MARILIAGLINLETNLKITSFPLHYAPVSYPFFGIQSHVSGVGFNITKALTTLQNDVQLLSIVGQDSAGSQIISQLQNDGIATEGVLPMLEETCQSVILYDASGQRAIHTDLKDIQDKAYPLESFAHHAQNIDIAVLCNINFTRPMLAQAKAMGIPIATDVHTIAEIDDAYNRDYMASADILFQSHERLPCSPETWAQRVYDAYGTPIIVIGCGAGGAVLMAHGDSPLRLPAVQTVPIVNAVGAGDALFSAFVHGYAHIGDAYESLRRAILFASHKIGTSGASQGFLNLAEWDELPR